MYINVSDLCIVLYFKNLVIYLISKLVQIFFFGELFFGFSLEKISF